MAAAKPFRVVPEGEKRRVQEKVGEWEELLRRMRFASLRLEGEAGERYRQILKGLVIRAEALKARWEQIRSRLYVAEAEWRGVLESLESLEQAYEEVRGEVESRSPSETSDGLAA